MGYLHVEIETSQFSKRPGQPCGDVVELERTASHTTPVVCDGIGSGVKANIIAGMCCSRLLELLRQGKSLRQAFAAVARTMEGAKGVDLPYAAFTAVRILNDGVATVLTYEAPPPLLVTSRYAQVLPQRTVTVDSALVREANCHLAPGEGLLVVSDGITQAGLGNGYAEGWTAAGLAQYVSDCVSDGLGIKHVPEAVIHRAREIWGKRLGDDCTAVLASCRRGKIVNILTGPPADRSTDREVVWRFMLSEGAKVVSGGTTAKLVAEALGKDVLMEENPQSMLAPPTYMIEGVDLVTEGAVSLNQVYNVLDEDSERFDEESGVTQLHELLKSADRVNILMGGAVNPATRDISFRQKGILTRHIIVPLIAQKLREMGKLVVVEQLK